MSLLCVTVRGARFTGTTGQFNSYVNLKLQNVKSTTVAVKGTNPSWEQDFIFETNRMDTGLVIEVWNKGMLWDKLVGCQWLPLMGIQYSTEVGEGEWLSLDSELILADGEVRGTKNPTGHSILIEAHFELPYDLQDDTPELQEKLEMLNSIMDQEITSFREQQKRPLHTLNSGISEDSDYTSDVGYPASAQHQHHQQQSQQPGSSAHHPNSSASQFGAQQLARGGASLAGGSGSLQQQQGPLYADSGGYGAADYYAEPLYYNSRPPHHQLRSARDVEPPPRKEGRRSYADSPRSSAHYAEADAGRPPAWDESARESGRGYSRRHPTRKPSLERQASFEGQGYEDSSYEYPDTRTRGYPVQQDSYESYRDEASPPPHGRNWNYPQEDPYYPYDQQQRSTWATAADQPHVKAIRGLPGDPQSNVGPQCEPYGGYDSAGFFSGADRTDGLFQYSPQHVETTRPFGIPEFSPTHDDDDAATYIEYPDGQMVVEYPDGKVVEYPTIDSAPIVTRSEAYSVPTEVRGAVPPGANRLPQPEPEPPPTAALAPVDEAPSRRRSFYEPAEPDRKPEPPGLKSAEPERRRSFYETKQQLAPAFEAPTNARTGDDAPSTRRRSFYEANEPATVPSPYEPRSEPAKRKDSASFPVDEAGSRRKPTLTRTDGRRKASPTKMEGDASLAPPEEEHAPPRKTGVSVSFCEEVNQVYPGPPASAEEPVPEEPVPVTDSLAVPTALAAAAAAADDRPPIVAVTAEPGMSRGKLHWLSAFNRIVNQLNEAMAVAKRFEKYEHRQDD